MSRFLRILSAWWTAALLAACVPSPAAIVPGTVLQSEKPREAAPQVPPGDFAEAAAGNRAFALNLYQALDAKTENLFFSPYSISLALAMAYGGARGETARQMAEALHFTLPQDQLHPAFNHIDQELASRKEAGGQGADGKGFRLNVVNDMWGQKDYTFQPEYLDLLAGNYGAGLRVIDFASDPAGSRKTINDYIAKKTEDRIKDLVPPDVIVPETRLVLTNAIYFNAAWQYPFSTAETKDEPFTRLDGSQVNVPMMNIFGPPSFRYLQGDGYQAVALPYENQPISMILLVPEAGRFEEFAAALDLAMVDAITTGMQSRQVQLSMPKFEIKDEFELVEVLSKLGMVDAFLPGQADFSGIDGTRSLSISDVIHKSFVKVDEQGTEAAAATVVAFPVSAPAEPPVSLTVDRPFLFLMYDDPTGSILFMGQLTNPE